MATSLFSSVVTLLSHHFPLIIEPSDHLLYHFLAPISEFSFEPEEAEIDDFQFTWPSLQTGNTWIEVSHKCRTEYIPLTHTGPIPMAEHLKQLLQSDDGHPFLNWSALYEYLQRVHHQLQRYRRFAVDLSLATIDSYRDSLSQLEAISAFYRLTDRFIHKYNTWNRSLIEHVFHDHPCQPDIYDLVDYYYRFLDVADPVVQAIQEHLRTMILPPESELHLKGCSVTGPYDMWSEPALQFYPQRTFGMVTVPKLDLIHTVRISDLHWWAKQLLFVYIQFDPAEFLKFHQWVVQLKPTILVENE